MKPHNRPICSALVAILLLTSCLYANASLNAGFSYQQDCNGEIVFTASNQTYSSYAWTFGDGNSGAGTTVSHQYIQGIYTATLTVQDAGNTSASSQQIFISEYITQHITGPVDVCTGSRVTYSLNNVSANFQYTWLLSGADMTSGNRGSDVEIDFPDAGSAVLSVIISNGAGCDSVLQYNIQVQETPRLIMPGQTNDTIQTGLTICQNSSVWYHVLSMNGTNGNITWSSGTGTMLSPQGVDSMLFVFPNAGTTYLQIAETTPTGCTDTLLVIVEVTESPSIIAGGTNACLGSDNYFTSVLSTGGNSPVYQWSFDDGTDAIGNNPSHTFPTTGQHIGQLIVTNGDGCTDTAAATVQVDANPGPEIECVGPVCTGDAVVYSTPVVPGANYHWTITGGAITSGGTLTDNTIGVTWGSGAIGTVELFLTGPGIYCQFPTIEYVQIIGGALAIQGDITPCRYTTETYTTDIIPGGVYTWTVTNGYIQNGQGTHELQVYFNNATSSNIGVNITHQILSCNSAATLAVTPLSPFQVYGSDPACVGVTANFNTYATGNFSWTVENGIVQTGNGTGSMTAYWNAPGLFRVGATIPTGYCNTEAHVYVNVVERKHETIEGKNLVCVGTNEMYNISPDNSSYTWSVLSGGAIVGGALSNIISVSWNLPGTHIIRVIYQDVNYCPDTSFFTVTVAPESVPEIIGDTITCYGNAETYSFVPATGVSYVWETEGGIITSGQNSANISVLWIGNQIGLLRLRNTICNTFIQKHIIIRPTPEVHIKSENLTCDGSSADLRVVEDYPSYIWSNSLTTQSITIATTGFYSVTVADALGCTATGIENVSPIPDNGFITFYIAVSVPSVPIPYAYLELTAMGNPLPVSCLWNTGNTELTQYVSQGGTYTVTITNEFGCTAVMSAIVTTGPLQCNGGVCTGGGTRFPCPGISPVFTTNSPVCNPVQFTPGVTANYYHWDFNDGVFSTLSNPSHRFNSAGTKTVILNYSNDGINWFECSQNLVINSVMNISFEDTGGCKGLVEFTNTSVSALPVTSVLWRLGDGNTSGTNPVLNYQYPNTASSYLVTLILDDGTCVDSLQKQISVHSLIADFASSGVCKDNPALFNSTTIHTRLISSYAWDFGNSETADYYNPVTYYDAAGNYTVGLIVKDEDGCLDNVQHIITVNEFLPLPVAASGPLTFCKGSSVDLNIPAGYTSYWNTGETTNSIHVIQSGDYYAWLKDNSTGCSGFSDTAAVIVNIPSRAFIRLIYGEPEMCEGDYFQLHGLPNSGVTYQWYRDGNAIGTTYYYSSWNALVSETGDYQLVITDASGCKDTSNILHIDVHPLPATPYITQSPSGSHCDGEPVTLSVSSSDLIQWSNGSTGNSITVYHNASIQVIATNSFGCASTDYDYVNYNPLPDLRYFPEGCYQVCENDNVTISGPAGMQSYLWSNGATTQSITLSASGDYSLTATTSAGCTDESASFTVDVFDAGNIQLGNDTFICVGQTVVLDAGVYPSITWQDNSNNQTFTVTDSGMYTVQVVNTAGCISMDSVHVSSLSGYIDLGNDTALCNGATLQLEVTGNFTSILWNDNSTTSIYNVTQSGLYSVTVTTTSGCTATDNITVSIFTADNINLGNDTFLCAGQTLDLDAGVYPSITWQDNSNNQIFTVTDSGLYIVQVTNSGGCISIDSIHVSSSGDYISLGNDTTLCANSTLQLEVTGNFTGVFWHDNSTGSTYTVTQPGLYSVTATTTSGCTATDNITVSYFPDNTVILPTTIYMCDLQITLSPDSSFRSYLWSTGETTSSITVADTGVYSVTVADINGCSSLDITSVLPCNSQRTSECQNQYAVPNAFTPNGDGNNDLFIAVRNQDTPKSRFFSLKVFNRWGSMMFETNNENAGWDGKFRGSEMPPGVSVYIFQYVCDDESIMREGSITLLR